MPVIEALRELAGRWAGTNEFRLMPADPAERLATTAELTLVARNGVSLAYTWSHPADGPQEGFALLHDAEDGSAAATWLDSWHQSPQAATLTGTADSSGTHLRTTYGGGDWGWAIHVEPAGAGLRITMTNEGPGIPAYAAMTAVYERSP
ncbi:hypothetical protein [Longispora albida]|uniref:hypothetical protein n=1 Tax=Longispora albida TaxID=203523 RepID=UPI00036EF8E5|nr:hypothetical protein [Longispora albida]